MAVAVVWGYFPHDLITVGSSLSDLPYVGNNLLLPGRGGCVVRWCWWWWDVGVGSSGGEGVSG